MSVWLLIGTVALVTVGLKTVGPVVAGGRQFPQSVQRIIVLLGVALMAALVVSNTFVTGRALVFDERAGGLLVGLIALLCRAPLALAVVLAAATYVLLRTPIF